MKMKDFEALKLTKEQELEVSTSNGKFYGKFNKLSLNGARLDLVEVKNEKGECCGRFKNLNQKDILAVKVLGSENSVEELTSSNPSTTNTSEQSTCQLSSKQLEHIEKLNKCPVHVNQPGSTYFNALNDIYKQFTVAVGTEDSKYTRLYSLKTLTISTNDNVYIFYPEALNAKKTMNDLKEFFEGSECLKVFFDCRFLLDNLKHNFGIEINNFFDLKLAASQFHPKHLVTTLEDCIKTVLGVEHSESSQQTAFQLALHHKLIQANFSSDFQQKLKKFLTPKKPACAFFEEFKRSKNQQNHISFISGIEDIDFSVYEEN